MSNIRRSISTLLFRRDNFSNIPTLHGIWGWAFGQSNLTFAPSRVDLASGSLDRPQSRTLQRLPAQRLSTLYAPPPKKMASLESSVPGGSDRSSPAIQEPIFALSRNPQRKMHRFSFWWCSFAQVTPLKPRRQRYNSAAASIPIGGAVK